MFRFYPSRLLTAHTGPMYFEAMSGRRGVRNSSWSGGWAEFIRTKALPTWLVMVIPKVIIILMKIPKVIKNILMVIPKVITKHLNEDTKGHNKTSATSREAITRKSCKLLLPAKSSSPELSPLNETFFNYFALPMIFMLTWSLLCLIKREFKIKCYHSDTLFDCDQWGFLTEEQNLIDQNLTVICQGCIENITV